jgi:hypothetical protein
MNWTRLAPTLDPVKGVRCPAGIRFFAARAHQFWPFWDKGSGMLIWFVIIYWIISVGIGLWAALRVKGTADFAVAGRSLPFYIVTATVFATWFGSDRARHPGRVPQGRPVRGGIGSLRLLALPDPGGPVLRRPLYR